MTMTDIDVVNTRRLEPLRERLDRNALLASGILPGEAHSTGKRIVLPTAARDQTPARVAESYLSGTSWGAFFSHPIPFAIPFPVRTPTSSAAPATARRSSCSCRSARTCSEPLRTAAP